MNFTPCFSPHPKPLSLRRERDLSNRGVLPFSPLREKGPGDEGRKMHNSL